MDEKDAVHSVKSMVSSEIGPILPVAHGGARGIAMVNARALSGVLVLVLTLIGYGCGGKKPKVEVPPAIEEFKTQAMKFVEAGTQTAAKASQGVSFSVLKPQVVSTKADHDLLLAVWPKAVPTDSQKDFAKAIEGWNLALELWALKIKKADNPTAPSVNGFNDYIAYGLEGMVVERHGKDFLVEPYRNKNFLPFDINIKILLYLAERSFYAGRTKILKELDEKSILKDLGEKKKGAQ